MSWLASAWDSISTTVNSLLLSFTPTNDDHIPPGWNPWRLSSDDLLWTAKPLTFRSQEDMQEVKGFLWCALESNMDARNEEETIIGLVGVSMGNKHPFDTTEGKFSKPWLILKFGIAQDQPICVSYIGAACERENSVIHPFNHSSIKWEHATAMMRIHLSERSFDETFLKRYKLTVISEGTLQQLTAGAVELVSRKGRKKMGGL